MFRDWMERENNERVTAKIIIKSYIKLHFETNGLLTMADSNKHK